MHCCEKFLIGLDILGPAKLIASQCLMSSLVFSVLATVFFFKTSNRSWHLPPHAESWVQQSPKWRRLQAEKWHCSTWGALQSWMGLVFSRCWCFSSLSSHHNASVSQKRYPVNPLFWRTSILAVPAFICCSDVSVYDSAPGFSLRCHRQTRSSCFQACINMASSSIYSLLSPEGLSK